MYVVCVCVSGRANRQNANKARARNKKELTILKLAEKLMIRFA